MKKLVIVLLILGTLAFLVYQAAMYYFPKAIAEALVSNEDLAMVPPELKEQVGGLHEEVEAKLEELPEVLSELELGYDELVELIDEVDQDQFDAAMEDLKSNAWKTTDEAFDICIKHLQTNEIDQEKLRKLFNTYASTELIQEGLDAAEELDFLSGMMLPIAKETARNMLKSKKEEILLRSEERE